MARSDRRARQAVRRAQERQATVGSRRLSNPAQAEPTTLYPHTTFILDVSRLDEGTLA